MRPARSADYTNLKGKNWLSRRADCRSSGSVRWSPRTPKTRCAVYRANRASTCCRSIARWTPTFPAG